MSQELHALCVKAVNQMVRDLITRHTSYISAEDRITFDIEKIGRGKLIPKVTIEWVEKSEVEAETT